METLNKIAERTREVIDGDDKDVIKFDPMTIAVIIGVLIGIVNMLKGCFPQPTPSTLDTVKHPRLHHYGKIRRLVRKECKAKGLRYDKEVYNAVLKARNELTLDEIDKVYGEVN